MRSLFGLTLIATLIIAQPLRAQTGDSDRVGARITAIADEYEREFKRTFPVLAELYGFTDMQRDRFDANTPAALRAWRAREDRWAAELERIDGGALWGRPEWVTYGYLQEALATARGLRVCRIRRGRSGVPQRVIRRRSFGRHGVSCWRSGSGRR